MGKKHFRLVSRRPQLAYVDGHYVYDPSQWWIFGPIIGAALAGMATAIGFLKN